MIWEEGMIWSGFSYYCSGSFGVVGWGMEVGNSLLVCLVYRTKGFLTVLRLLSFADASVAQPCLLGLLFGPYGTAVDEDRGR